MHVLDGKRELSRRQKELADIMQLIETKPDLFSLFQKELKKVIKYEKVVQIFRFTKYVEEKVSGGNFLPIGYFLYRNFKILFKNYLILIRNA